MAKNILYWLGWIILLAACAVGAFQSFRSTDEKKGIYGERTDVPLLSLYTAPTATTPQLPLWAGISDGKVGELCRIKLELWKDVDALKSILLAGKGDLWVGHVEAFALARKRGAPVQLLAITGWKKFYILSTNPQITKLEDFVGNTLPSTPAGNPGVMIAKVLLGKNEKSVDFLPVETKQAIMLLLRGGIDSILAPEPIVSMFLAKVKNLRVIANLEELYGDRMLRPPRFPLAGIAINADTAARLPSVASSLLDILLIEGKRLETDPSLAERVFPQSFAEFLPHEVLRESLSREIIHVEAAEDVEAEIAEYLRLIQPSLLGSDGGLALDSSFIYRRPGGATAR